MMSLRDKVILITGASSGIGAELARQCARRGSKLVLAARSEPLLASLCQEITSDGGHALAIPTDVTRPEEIRRMFDKTLEKWGRLDVLVNNAGFGVWGVFDDLPMELIRANFETNVFATVACAQAAAAEFRKRKEGLIVNVESIVALRAMPLSSCYSATKHALHAFSESMRVEFAADGIRVLSVCPGLISTPFHDHRVDVGSHFETGPKWLYMPVDRCVARMIRAMERGRRQVVITGHARFLALLQRIAPRFLDWIFARNYQRFLQASAQKCPPTISPASGSRSASHANSR